MRNIELMSRRTSRCIFLPFRVDEIWLWWCRCCCLPMNEWMNVGGWLVICPQVISCSIIATYEWTEMTSSCYESHAEWMVHVCCSLVCIRWVGASCARDECVDGGFVTLHFFRVDVEHLWLAVGRRRDVDLSAGEELLLVQLSTKRLCVPDLRACL